MGSVDPQPSAAAAASPPETFSDSFSSSSSGSRGVRCRNRQLRVVHPRVAKVQNAPEVFVVVLRHDGLLIAVHGGEGSFDGAVLGDEGVCFFDTNTADVWQKVAPGQHAQTEEEVVRPAKEIKGTTLRVRASSRL